MDIESKVGTLLCSIEGLKRFLYIFSSGGELLPLYLPLKGGEFKRVQITSVSLHFWGRIKEWGTIGFSYMDSSGFLKCCKASKNVFAPSKKLGGKNGETRFYR